MDSLISVVVPVYRTEAFLNRCVESIVGQTYANLEILLVDDGSPDSCPRLCDEWAARDSRIKVIHQANAGAGMARNAGIEAAAGDFICFFDSDDYVAPDAIEKAYRLAMAEQSDLVVFGLTTLDTAGRVTARIIPEPDRITFAGEDVQKRFLPDLIAARAQGVCRNIWMNAWSCLFSMPMIRKTGWRFVSEREIFSEDVYSLLCLYRHVRRVSILPEALYFYCENSASLTHSYRADRFEAICRFHDASVHKALELGCPEASERFQGLLLRFVIAAMKQIVCADMPERDRYRAIREIVHSDYLKRIRWDYSLHFDSRARRLFLFSLDKGLTPVCYLLLKAKTAGH